MSSTPSVPRLKKMVEIILDENPKYQGVEARNSDIALTILIWQRWYSVSEAIQVARLFNLPREDNVKRVRAVFQNTEHKYLPTDPSILIKRGIEEAYWFDALGYNLTADEWRTHHQTVKETTPPKIDYGHLPSEPVGRLTPDETDMLIAGETVMKPYTPNPDALTPVVYTTKLRAIYLPKSYGSALQTGQEYEIELERLATGHPIKMVAPIEAQYLNLQAFAKTWQVVQ